MDKRELKRIWKKTWHFIWEDDSIWSWIVNIILAFILIKFIVYPVLGLLLATSHPIVAVVSGSMEHDGSFDDWWQSPALCGEMECRQVDRYAELNISKEEFRNFHFKNGFNKGDIMILYGSKNIKVGDVIVFQTDRPDPIIHRVIMIKDGKYYTKGDHNPASFYFENEIEPNTVIGEAVLRIPFVGYIKIWFVDLLRLIRVI